MERIINIVGTGLIALVIGAIVLNLVQDPMSARRAYLKQALAGIQATNDDEEGAQWEFEKWNSVITGKSGVWTGLVPAPPPPPPAPPPPPQRPDLAQMLNGLKASRQKVGEKIKIITADNPKGAFYAVGDTVNGLKVKAFDKTTVTLSLEWKEGKEELTQTIPRE